MARFDSRTQPLPQQAVTAQGPGCVTLGRSVLLGMILGLVIVLVGYLRFAPADNPLTAVITPSSVITPSPNGVPQTGIPAVPTLLSGSPTYATGGENGSLLLGNPSEAGHVPDNYLLEKPQFSLAYNRSNGAANWVAWHVERSDFGPAERSPTFQPDPLLRADWQILPTDYAFTESGYHRGHLCPSADRTSTRANNDATFTMTNVIPQAPALNLGAWLGLENYCRDLVNRGYELYIVAGGTGSRGRIAGGKVNVPQSCWKVIVVLPQGDNDLARITDTTRVITVLMPNQDATGDWGAYLTNVTQLQNVTGYFFFSTLPPDVQSIIKQKVDSG